MKYLLLLMAAPQFAFAGTLAAHSNDFKALEILETSQPPAAPPAPKPAPKPKPKPAPKPAPAEPSAEAKALDALMAAGPDVAPAPTPALKKTVSVKHPLRIVAQATKPKVKVKAKAKTKPKPDVELEVVELDPIPAPVKKSRYINYAKGAPKAPKTAPKFAMSAPTKSAQVPSKIEFNKPKDSSDEIETTDAPAPAPTVAAIVPNKPSADSEALDALIESTPDSPRSALTRGPVSIPAAQEVEVEEEQESRPVRSSRRYANDDEPGLIDPNEIQRVSPKKIQNVWY